ncbi:hypothetical protein CK203_004399 [Vitis vinifera]|uniref:Retrotransposon Copia-like N-terminal domain-containing protein n=1 Tax=Vitis vinifera TaxID=29760 RepID=A0A438K9J2_VITVI|nr:hypothetical protein CK203_004399 [Vitis vinifera]
MKNYLKWAQSMKLTIDGKGKLRYLTGEVTQPIANDLSLKKWQSENSLVIAWLINSMELTIGKPHLFYQQPMMFGRENSNDCAPHKKREENDRVYMFFTGLNRNLDEVRGRILGRNPLPSIHEVFSDVRHEKSQMRIMLQNLESSSS